MKDWREFKKKVLDDDDRVTDLDEGKLAITRFIIE